MTQLFELRDIHLAYDGRPLLDGVNATLHDDRQIALIGINGAGKSTLCRILIGSEEPDSGEIVRSRDLRLGYLRQDNPFEEGESARDFLMRDSGQPDWRCGEVAGKFGFDEDHLTGAVTALSGGWQTRLKLAGLLLHEPNLLILDEPTNFLDLRTQLLLQRFLKDWRAGCLVVSHDRTFLNETCCYTMELAGGKIYEHRGSVAEYLTARHERLEREARENANRIDRMKQLQRFIDKNRAGANTASQARSKQKELDRIELHDTDIAQYQIRLKLPESAPLRTTALHCQDLTIGYPGVTVARDVSFDLEPGARLAIAGDNGEGKTTLLRTLTGSLEPLGGSVKWAKNAKLCVYAQHVYSALPHERTVLEYLMQSSPTDVTEKEVLRIAGGFRFGGGAVKKRIGVLSGGERARLCLAGLFLECGNVLVLDEPVNHLDVETVQALAEALTTYEGTVILVSHDRDFACAVATEVIEMSGGRASRFPGDFAAYVQSLSSDATASTPSGTESNGLDGNERFRIQKQINAIERKTLKLEDRIRELSDEVAGTADWEAAHAIQLEVDGLRAEKDQLDEEWLQLHETLEG